MLRIQPMCLFADGPDHYWVRCEHEGGEVEYKFTMEEWETETRALIDYEKAFFYVSHDDFARDWLVWAIIKFDNARHYGIEISNGQLVKLHPKSLAADGGDAINGYRYRVAFESDAGEIEYIFTVTFEDNIGRVMWKLGSWSAKWDGFHWQEVDGDLHLTRTILMFHQTRQSKYSDDGTLIERGLC